MLVLIGVQANDDQYLSDYRDALAVSHSREKLERYRDWYRINGDNPIYIEYEIKEILDLDKEG